METTSPVSPPLDVAAEALSTQHEHLLNEVESAEGQLGAILRTLYDGEDQVEFLQSLSSRIKNHEKDIERMCNKNYQGFIESVSELHKVKSEANKLKRKIREADTIIQETGRDLMASAEQLMLTKMVQKNILSTIDTLNLCIPVLQQYCKLNEQMDKRNYYSALKTLEQLEHTLLPPVKGYIFSDLLKKEIPKIRKSIEDQSIAELTDFLTKIRESSVIIGEVAMHQAQKHSFLELDLDVLKLLDPTQDLDPEMCAQDLVDFSPVYRCLHIHSVVGKRESFMEDYRNQRRMQVRLAIKPHGHWKGNINDYKKFFYGIVGFFVVEDTILHTTQSLTSKTGSREESLVTRKIVNEFWTMAQDEALAVLRSNCSSCVDYYLLLKVKQLVVWFCNTLRGYGFEVDKLYEVLLEIREHYDELLMKAWGAAFTNIFDSDDFCPLEVLTDERYQGVMETFPYHNKQLATAEFPKRFPFSSMVHQIYEQLKQFVMKCNSYSLKLNMSQTEIDECVRKSVNLLLTRTMTSCLSKLIHKGSLNVPQLVQIWINIDHLDTAMGELEKFISRTTKTVSERGTTGRLFGASTFKDAKQLSEKQIIETLDKHMTQIMDGVEYDWTPKDPIETTSDFIRDMIAYLESMFATLLLLPDSVSGDICFQGLSRLSLKLERMIMSDEVERINSNGFISFSVDVASCEKFLSSSVAANSGLQSVPGANLVFRRLREVLDLFVEKAWTTYVNEYSDPSNKYRSVNPHLVHALLFKLRLSGKKKKKLTLHIKRSGGRKDEMKLALLRLKGIVHQEQTDGSSLQGRRFEDDSEGSLGPGSTDS